MDTRLLLFEVHFGGQFVLLSSKTYIGKLDYLEDVGSICYGCVVNLVRGKCNFNLDDEIHHNPTFEKLKTGLYQISSEGEHRIEIKR